MNQCTKPIQKVEERVSERSQSWKSDNYMGRQAIMKS